MNMERRYEQENGGAKSSSHERSVYRQENHKRQLPVTGLRLKCQVGHINFRGFVIPTPRRLLPPQITTAGVHKSCVPLEFCADARDQPERSYSFS
jgi:hypothetical protein